MHSVSFLLFAIALSGSPEARPALPMNPTCSFITTAAPLVGPGAWRVNFAASIADQTASRPKAVEYSHGYEVRLRIHRDASFAMLPLFGAQAIVGGKLFNDPTSRGLKTAHGVLNVGILGLFAIDTVTGVWNLKEGWHDPNGRARRLVHGLLMLAADGGFVATAAHTPQIRNGVDVGSTSKSTHRTLAIASISTATAGYLVMIFR